MNDTINNRTYTKFSKHIDNANEVIKAKDINIIQESVINSELNITGIKDVQFIDKAMQIFENCRFVNSIFANEMNEKDYIDFSKSNNINYDENKKLLYVDKDHLEGEAYTLKISSLLGDDVSINDFYIISDELVPIGSSIKYYLLNQFNESFPIIPNTIKKPLHIFSKVTNITIKVVITKNALGESPNLYGLCLMYFDEEVDNGYGLINPDLRRFSSAQTGDTTLIRDRALKDKLVKVIQPTGVTYLSYLPNGSLDKVFEDNQSLGVEVTDTLGYGNYFNSKSETEILLLKIHTTVKTVDITKNPIDYNYNGA